MYYQYAPAETVNHGERNVWWVGAKSYKLIHVLMVHVSHLKRKTIVVISTHGKVNHYY